VTECPDAVCGGRIEASSGVIRSPSFPDWYPSHRDCFWTIVVPTGSYVEFTIGFLEIELSSNCTKDFLEVATDCCHSLHNTAYLVVHRKK